MTTAVASPPSFPSLPRMGWNSGIASAGGTHSMDDVTRMFMPRKNVQRTNSSSSVSSTGSSASTATAIQQSSAPVPQMNGDSASYAAKKKTRGGFWPTAKAEPVVNGLNGRPQVSTSPSTTSNTETSPVAPTQHLPQQSGARVTSSGVSNEASALLALLPMNGTFERKQINVPFFPDVLRVGRQTNAKTVPTPSNGFFDSKVLSRQHAEVWAERNGKIWIRDVKSSNGTFVNGHRLSPENRDSEPQELHQHDTLELGIDIVSEDQKVIVHHKVSAKVEYVGIPGTSNNVLDLNFGDLDPSQHGNMLSTSMSQPMVASRGRGAPLPNGRFSAPSSVAGTQLTSLAQQRQLNFWSTPLNVEHLVKTLSAEMKAAKQQAQELEQTSVFLTGLMSADPKDGKPSPSPVVDSGQQRITNGKAKGARMESISRFSEPPAPPPQQPLPEKPDIPRSSPTEPSSHSFLRRSETAKAGSPFGGSPTNTHSSQILSLVEALNTAKKDLDSQAAKVKHLEDLLQEERAARERAEERARRLEQSDSFQPVKNVEFSGEDDVSSPKSRAWADVNGSLKNATLSISAESELQQKLDTIVAEMAVMKKEMDHYQKRADTAENDASTARASLAEMVTRLRNENAAAAADAEKAMDLPALLSCPSDVAPVKGLVATSSASPSPKHLPVNGHVRAPSRLPEPLERALATVLRDGRNTNGEVMMQTAPYASMLGVILLGVGLMAYVNSWQKGEK